jgi:hypothetical protein
MEEVESDLFDTGGYKKECHPKSEIRLMLLSL